MSTNIDDRAGPATQGAPKQPPTEASFDERLRYVEAAASHGIAEQRRQADVVRGIASTQAEMQGVLIRVESVVLTLAARQANMEREETPPSMEQLQALRAKFDAQAKKLQDLEHAQKLRQARRDAQLREHERRLDRFEKVDDTSRREAMTSDVALSALAAANAKLAESNTKRDEVDEKREEATKGRRFVLVQQVFGVFLILAGGYALARLQACAGAPIPIIPVPALTASPASH